MKEASRKLGLHFISKKQLTPNPHHSQVSAGVSAVAVAHPHHLPGLCQPLGLPLALHGVWAPAHPVGQQIPREAHTHRHPQTGPEGARPPVSVAGDTARQMSSAQIMGRPSQCAPFPHSPINGPRLRGLPGKPPTGRCPSFTRHHDGAAGGPASASLVYEEQNRGARTPGSGAGWSASGAAHGRRACD